VENHVAALRFLYVRTLKRYEFREYIPYPRVPRKLPGILSKEEVARLINSSGTLFNRPLLMVLYGTGMRRAEAARLKLDDIDSQRMIIHVVNGKGGKDRDLPLSPALLETLRAHWRCFKPCTYVFPSRYSRLVEKPITDKAVWQIATLTARQAGIRKRVTPHTLRHSWASLAPFAPGAGALHPPPSAGRTTPTRYLLARRKARPQGRGDSDRFR
jgi:integrase/recombinase XerD